MKIATWNINSLAVRLPQVLDWLAANPVEVLCLQELKLPDDKFPRQELLDAGYYSAVLGQKTYNGVAILSRKPAQDVVRNIPGFDDGQARVIAATLQAPDGPLRIMGAYFVNGQEPGSEKFAYKLHWLAALRNYLQGELQTHRRLVLLGDFNVAPGDDDTYDPEGLRGTIHHTEQERAEFRALLDLGMADAFRAFAQKPGSYSWWDYRAMAFRRNHGLRIDHILISHALCPYLRACNIDTTPRKNERPSDHAPVIATLDA